MCMHASRKIAKDYFDLQKGSYSEHMCYLGTGSCTISDFLEHSDSAQCLCVCFCHMVEKSLGSAEEEEESRADWATKT